MVLDATATHVQVELHARHKVVTVLFDNIRKVGGKEGKIHDTTKKELGADDWGDVGGENMEDLQARSSGGAGAGASGRYGGMEGGATPSGDAFDGGTTPMGGGNSTPSGNFDVQDTPIPEPEHFPPEEEDGWGGDGVAMDDAGMERERDDLRSRREEEEEHERRERARRRRDEEEEERRNDQRSDVASSSSSSSVVDDVALVENWVTERAFVRVRQQVRVWLLFCCCLLFVVVCSLFLILLLSFLFFLLLASSLFSLLSSLLFLSVCCFIFPLQPLKTIRVNTTIVLVSSFPSLVLPVLSTSSHRLRWEQLTYHRVSIDFVVSSSFIHNDD